MNEIQLFSNPEFGEIRTLEINGEPWFVGKDIAVILGYTNPQKAIRDHVDEDDKTVNETFSVNGTAVVLINESGLYSLVLQSKLPTAKQFKRWVTSEVLPAIRKHGIYTAKHDDGTKSRRLDIQEMNAKARQAKVMLDFAKLDICTASKELLASNAVFLMTGNRILPEPKVEKTYTANEVGKILGVSGNMIGRIANANNIKTSEYGDYVLDCNKNGKQMPNFRYNEAGLNKLRELIRSDEDDEG